MAGGYIICKIDEPIILKDVSNITLPNKYKNIYDGFSKGKPVLINCKVRIEETATLSSGEYNINSYVPMAKVNAFGVEDTIFGYFGSNATKITFIIQPDGTFMIGAEV